MNVATGHRYCFWLPEVQLPIGVFALLAQDERGVVVYCWLDARTVEVSHRDDTRLARSTTPEGRRDRETEMDAGEVPSELMSELEEYLRRR